MFYFWLALVIVLSIIEIATTNLVSIWFVASGILAMIGSLFTDNILIQIFIFVILGVLFMILTKKVISKIIPNKVKTNIDRIVGMKGKVIKEICPNKPGEIKVDGKIWTALSKEKIAEGEQARILEIDSTKLKVEKIKE